MRITSNARHVLLSSVAGAVVFATAVGASAAEVATTAAAAPAEAFASPEADPNAIAEVVVTAEKREQSIQSVPASIVAIGGAQLRNLQINRANDISRFVPNFNGDPASGNTNPRWYLRGIGNSVPGNGQTSPLGVYEDEVYIGLPIAQAPPLFDLQRVEVLSGPQGTLFGKNTTAGAINFITAKPTFDPSGYVRAEYGSYNTSLLEGAYGGPITDKLAFRVAGVFQDNDGFATNHHDGSKIGKNRDADVRGELLWKPADNFTALLKVGYRNYYNSGINIYQGLNAKDTASVVEPQGDTNQSSYGASTINLEERNVQLNLDWRLGRYTLTSISAANFYESTNPTGTNVDHEGTNTYSSLGAHTYSQEIRLASPASDRLNWIVGGNYYYEHQNSDATTAVLPNTVNLAQSYSDTQFRQVTNSYAVFGSATWKITDRLNLTVGLRETVEQKGINLNTLASTGATTFSYLDTTTFWSRSSVAGSGLATVATQDAHKSWNALTYDASLDYRLIDNARVYVRYADGFRSGGFNPGASTQATVSVINPEYVKTYEGGLKTQWFSGRLVANLTAFYNDYKDIQVTVIQLPLSQITNAGAGWSKGVESVIQATPFNNLHLGGTLGLLDTRYTDFPNCKANISCTGNQFVRAPHVSLSLNGDYTVKFANGSDIGIENDWSYRSHLYFNAGTQTAPLEQGPEWYGNAKLFYDTPSKIKIYAWVRNITDSHAASTIIPSATLGYVKFIIDPRVAGVGASYAF